MMTKKTEPKQKQTSKLVTLYNPEAKKGNKKADVPASEVESFLAAGWLKEKVKT